MITSIVGLLALTATTSHTPVKPYKHPVTLWVPPYEVARSKAQLQLPGVKEAITHLDFQFWEPTKEGSVRLVHEPEVTEDTIHGLRDWAHANGIRAMLCVFNGENHWDWPLAKAAFADNFDSFAKALVTEMEREKLDGVDIDLEGPGDFESDKPAFLAFMKTLSKELHRRHKHLTVDSFSYKWNAPNQGWWPDLFPVVDALTTMGYQEIGSSAADWKSYTEQEKAAGKYAAKLQLGVPSDRDKWAGNTSLEQLNWIKNDKSAGIGIWDAQLPAATWKTPDIWEAIKGIRIGK